MFLVRRKEKRLNLFLLKCDILSHLKLFLSIDVRATSFCEDCITNNVSENYEAR